MNNSLRHRLSIHQACTSIEVIDAVAGYFTTLTASQIATLPEALRDTAAWDGERISTLANHTSFQSIGHGDDAVLLREVRSLLMLASLRLEIISMEARRPE